jgi:hypothetical protein
MPEHTKDPAAVSLGRRGGKVGGKAKNKRKGFGSMSPEQRAEISKQAAQKRWAKDM